MLYPLIFEPIFKERVWGGRNLEQHYRKSLPPDVPIGESWEISDRPGDVSVIANGPFAGRDLRWLMEQHGQAVLGTVPPAADGRFPVLVKILDAQEKLSVQVHPPASVAPAFHGEPKTEMWYVTHAEPGAEVFAGLKAGVDQAAFEQSIQDGTVADCLHRIPVKTDDCLFLPSGRIHALGPGNLIFEFQQNSNTTYRVFDWNRTGLDGKPRALHLRESLASINFDDHEPKPIRSRYSRNDSLSVRYLVNDPLFSMDAYKVRRGLCFYLRGPVLQILAVVKGRLRLTVESESLELNPGQFCLLPASLERVRLEALRATEYLHVQPGS